MSEEVVEKAEVEKEECLPLLSVFARFFSLPFHLGWTRVQCFAFSKYLDLMYIGWTVREGISATFLGVCGVRLRPCLIRSPRGLAVIMAGPGMRGPRPRLPAPGLHFCEGIYRLMAFTEWPSRSSCFSEY